MCRSDRAAFEPQISLADLIVTIEEPEQAYAALIQNNETSVTYRVRLKAYLPQACLTDDVSAEPIWLFASGDSSGWRCEPFIHEHLSDCTHRPLPQFFISYSGSDAGVLQVPVQDVVRSETSTGNDADLVLAITTPAPFEAIDRNAYNAFFAAITLTSSVDFSLHGGANGAARARPRARQ